MADHLPSCLLHTFLYILFTWMSFIITRPGHQTTLVGCTSVKCCKIQSQSWEIPVINSDFSFCFKVIFVYLISESYMRWGPGWGGNPSLVSKGKILSVRVRFYAMKSVCEANFPDLNPTNMVRLRLSLVPPLEQFPLPLPHIQCKMSFTNTALASVFLP